jgi:hypothetical protein
MDANFRMSRKNVSSQEKDPCLSHGSGYFVEDTGYHDHLEAHAAERQMVSEVNCSKNRLLTRTIA